MNIIISIIIALVLLGIVFGVAVPLMLRHNTRREDIERKWTDPKFHD